MSRRFRYRASTPSGELVEGVLEAGSRDELLDRLRGRRLHAVSVHEVQAREAGRSSGFVQRRSAVARWARNFATLLQAGATVDRALRVSAEQAGHERLSRVLTAVRSDVQEGESLSAALARHPGLFPSVVPSMARAGEASGAVGEVFAHVADHLEREAELWTELRSALLYPALMVAVAALGVAVLLLFVVPRFAVVVDDLGGTMPLTTRALVTSGTFLGTYWWVILGGLVLGAMGVRGWLERPGNRLTWHRWRLGLPVVGDVERKVFSARYARILGLLLGHGVPLLNALRIAREATPNLHIRSALDRGMATVAEGGSVSDGAKGVLPPLAVELLAVGEESGRLDVMCTRVASTYDVEIRRSTELAVSLLEPAMIIVFGGLVGLVALAMLQAIYSVNVNLG